MRHEYNGGVEGLTAPIMRYGRLVVYTPQIIENYQLKSGEGLSVSFVVIWLVGDACSLVGSMLAGLLPTIIILSAYVSVNVSRVFCFSRDSYAMFSTLYATVFSSHRFTTTGGPTWPFQGHHSSCPTNLGHQISLKKRLRCSPVLGSPTKREQKYLSFMNLQNTPALFYSCFLLD